MLSSIQYSTLAGPNHDTPLIHPSQRFREDHIPSASSRLNYGSLSSYHESTHILATTTYLPTETNEIDVPVRKKRKLDTVKCECCRRDKQKCIPSNRQWPQRCHRCIEKDFPCSEGKRAERKRTDRSLLLVDQTPLAAPIKLDSQVQELRDLAIEDWAFLANFHTIMLNAWKYLKKVAEDICSTFSLNIHDIYDIYDIRWEQWEKFEEFVTSLGSVVLRGARNIMTSPFSNEHSALSLAFMGQFLPDCLPASLSNCAMRNSNEAKMNLDQAGIIDNILKSTNVACQLLMREALWKQENESFWKRVDDSYVRHEVYHKLAIRVMRENVNTKAREMLRSLYLWDKTPSLVRRSAWFSPPDIDDHSWCESIENFRENIADCLGRTGLIKCVEDCKMYDCNVEEKLWELCGDGQTFSHILNHQDILGRTALHIASQRGDYNLVQTLLSLGASPSRHTITGSLPLHYAAAKGYSPICTTLLSEYHRRFDPNATDTQGETALYYAIYNGHVEAATALLKSGLIDPNRGVEGPLWAAIQRASQSLITQLLAAGADPSASDPSGNALHEAIRLRNFDITRILVNTEPSLMYASSWDDTTLLLAAKNGFVEGVQLLLNQEGIDVNAQDKNGYTPLMVAARQKNLDIMRLLLADDKTDLLLQNNVGETAIMLVDDDKIVSEILTVSQMEEYARRE